MGMEGRPDEIAITSDAVAPPTPARTEAGWPADRLLRIAARLLRTPMAAITLVAEDAVCIRAAIGIETGDVSREESFCGATVAVGGPVVIADARADPRFRQCGWVTGETGIRFYAGIPLRDRLGTPMGTLCCMDTLPRPGGVDPADLAALGNLAIMAAESLRQDIDAEVLAGQHARLAEHFHAVVEAIPLPLLTIDSAGLVTGWNPAAEQVFGWAAAEAVGRFGPHVPPEAIGEARALRAAQGEKLVGVEAERMRRDGSRLPVAISTAPLRDAVGRPEGAVVVIEDISERRRAEAEAAARAARLGRQAGLLARIATAMPEAGEDLTTAMAGVAVAAIEGLGGCDAGVWLHDPTEQDLVLVVVVDAQGQPLPADSPKRRWLQRLQFPPAFEAALQAGRQIAAEDAPTDPRIAHLRDGYIHPFGIGAMLTAPIRAGQEVLGIVSACSPAVPRAWTGEEKGFMASLADLAAVALEAGRRVRAMARLAAEKDRAEAASRAKSLLLGTLGHELRTPLNAIIGFAELLRAEELPRAERLEFADHVIGAGHHLLGVFNAMLDQARVESGALILAEAPVSLSLLIDEAAGLVLPEATTRGIRLDRRVPPGAYPALLGDAGRLRQAIANLVANAVKFSPAGGRVELGASFEAGLGYRIWVADEGPGMAAGDLPRAFEPFRQLDEGLRRRAGGAGLGLPLAKAFVEAHGGTLEVASTPGQGTRMTIILPASRVLPIDAGPTASAS